MIKRILVAVVAMVGIGLAWHLPHAHAMTPVVISELMIAGCHNGLENADETCDSDGRQEFLSIYNPNHTDFYMENWRVEFITSNGGTTRVLTELTGSLQAHSHALLAFEGYDFLDGTEPDFTFVIGYSYGMFPQSGGHVQIVDASGVIVDRLAWGNAEMAEEWPKVEAPQAGFSVKRILPGDADYDDTYTTYITNTPATPRGGSFLKGQGGEAPQTLDCEQAIVTELLPRPKEGAQFVELHNPTNTAISLEGCGLQRQGRVHIHWFTSEDQLAPGEYKAFYETTTGIALTKTVDGTLYYLNKHTQELQTVTYPAMQEAQAWAQFAHNTWGATFQVTPNAQNILQELPPTTPCPSGQERSPETNRCRNITNNQLTPCRPDQERNPETNRCRLISSTTSTLTPCREGQERNPDTNRCRAIVSNASTLTPCQPGQERNPETNRCRKIANNESSLKPCAPNQERNPETNRCRKVASLASAADPVDDITASTESSFGWWGVGAAAALVVGYGAWEWRRPLGEFVRRLFTVQKH